MLEPAFFTKHPTECAEKLIGCELHWGSTSGIIVETEAYAAVGDESCHTFNRKGAREFVNSNPPGTAYVYLSYGMYWLLNVLTKGGSPNNEGGFENDGFVLIRALQPLKGIPKMRERRGKSIPENKLCAGPGCLTIAMGVLPKHHGFNLCADEKHAFHYPSIKPSSPLRVLTDGRIGISKAMHFQWRFLLENSSHVSKHPPRLKIAS